MSTRRDFFAFTAGAVVAKTVLPLAARAEPAPHPDAGLIAVCAAFEAWERQINIIRGTGPDCVVDDDEANVVSAPIFARRDVSLDRMDELRATTAAGIQARAHSLALHAGHGDYSFDAEDTIPGRLLHYLMRDSAALGGSPPSTVASPDAELLEACAAYHACEDSRPAPNPDLVCNTPECDRHEALHEAITERADVMVGDLADMPAVTREGMQAKARAILLWDGGNALKGEPDDYSGDRLMASLLRHLLAGRPVA